MRRPSANDAGHDDAEVLANDQDVGFHGIDRGDEPTHGKPLRTSAVGEIKNTTQAVRAGHFLARVPPADSAISFAGRDCRVKLLADKSA